MLEIPELKEMLDHQEMMALEVMLVVEVLVALVPDQMPLWEQRGVPLQEVRRHTLAA
jgi:hypothetical protein